MPRYYFNLKNSEGTLLDNEGTELPDQEGARAHAHQVMQELMRNASPQTRMWRLAVSDQNLVPCFECLFASHDESIAHLGPELRSSVERVYRNKVALTDAIIDVRATLLQIQSTLARSDNSALRLVAQADDEPPQA
jgi:hypothetical protein